MASQLVITGIRAQGACWVGYQTAHRIYNGNEIACPVWALRVTASVHSM